LLDNKIFYHKITERIVSAFGDLFNNMFILRTDSNDNIVQKIGCPLSYGPKEKFIPAVDRLQQAISISYPRMAFELTGLTYDSDRKTHTMQKIRKVTADNKVLNYAWNSVPYNLSFELTIISRFTSDGLAIIEQILPYFTPEFNLKLNLIPSIDLIKDFPIVLEGVSPQHVYEFGQDSENKILSWTLNFKVKAEYIGYINSQGVITNVIAQLYASNTSDTTYQLENVQSANLIYAVSRYTVQPDPISSLANSDFGYAESWTIKTE